MMVCRAEPIEKSGRLKSDRGRAWQFAGFMQAL